MSQIQIKHLTFYYDGGGEDIFTDLSLSLDTRWKLGFVGRNGKGKTTFLKLLLGEYEYRGEIDSPVAFDYFPFELPDPQQCAIDLLQELDPDCEPWKIFRELNLLEMDAEVLYRPFGSLSGGEQTRVKLAALFARENAFLLIDEPTNHLDAGARRAVSRYLNQKSGFILVSHDRAFLDGCIDHVLAFNRSTIEVVQGNFSSWWENRRRQDEWERQENDRLRQEAGRLREAARRTEVWSDRVEKSKKGTKSGGLKPDRGYVGHKAAKMMKRAKSAESRMEKAAQEKEKLLKDVETAETLKLMPLVHHKKKLAVLENAVFAYGGPEEETRPVCGPLTFEVNQGERVLLEGRNGAGKSTVIKALLDLAQRESSRKPEECAPAAPGDFCGDVFGRKSPSLSANRPVLLSGTAQTAPGLRISYVSQDTSWLSGTLAEFEERWGLDAAVFRAVLRKLDFSRSHFGRDIGEFSEGQKKKILLARSLCEPAHLYIWDEPLNYIDIFSRIQLEELLLGAGLTLLFVEHDSAFAGKIATRRIVL